MKKLLRYILAYMFIITLSLTLLEISLRILLPIRQWFPEDMYTADTDHTISYRLTPGFEGEVKTAYFNYKVHVNDDGFRLTGSDNYKQEPVVAFFGDSFMFGQGVEDHETVPAYVNSNSESQINVLNAGVYGYTPHQEFTAYKRITEKQPVETIVLQLFNNDIVLQGETINRGVYRGLLNAAMPATTTEHIKAWLLTSFEVVAHTRRLVYLFAATDTTDTPPDFLRPSFTQSHAHEITSTKKLLLAWADEAKRRKQRFIVYFIPTVMEVAPEFNDKRKRWGKSLIGYDPEASYRWLVKLCDNRPDITFIDIKKLFQQAYLAGSPSLYILEDGHTNAEGNKVIASEVLKILKPAQ